MAVGPALARARPGRHRARGSSRSATRRPTSRRSSTLVDILPYVLLFGFGISLVVAPLTTTLMSLGAGGERRARVGDQQRDQRVGQPLLSALIFVVVSGVVLRALAAAVPGVRPRTIPRSGRRSSRSTRRAGRRRRRSPRRRRRRRSTRCGSPSLVCAALLRGRRGGERDRAAAAVGRGREPGAGDRAAGVARSRLPLAEAPGARARTTGTAPTYDRVADPMTRWGASVLDRLPLRGDETVLDAGCGSGRVTEQLARAAARRARVDRARRLAVDGRGRARPAGAVRRSGRRTWSRTSAGRCRSSPRPSTRSSRPRPSTGSPTTTRCSRTSRRVLRPGGRLVAQCGGAGQHRGACRRGPRRDRRRLARPVDVRDARGDARAPRGRRASPTSRRWLNDELERVRARRAVPRVPADGRPRRAPRAAARATPSATRSSMPSPSGAPGRRDRLRAAQHPRDPRLSRADRASARRRGTPRRGPG